MQHDILEAIFETLSERFNNVETELKHADPILLRAFLQSAIESIEITTSREVAGSRFKYTFESAKLI